MILVCPNCATRFSVPSDKIGPEGRNVRCGKCGHTWLQSPAVVEEAIEEEPPRDDALDAAPPDFSAALDEAAAEEEPRRPLRAMLEEDEAPRPRFVPPKPFELPEHLRPKRRVWLGWVLVLAILGGAGGGVVVARDDIVAAWPSSALLFQEIGLPVPIPGEGLVIRGLDIALVMEGEQQVMFVKGEVVNLDPTEKQVPTMRAVLRDIDRKPLLEWTFKAEGSRLRRGQVTSFNTDLARPPAEAADLFVTFVPGG